MRYTIKFFLTKIIFLIIYTGWQQPELQIY